MTTSLLTKYQRSIDRLPTNVKTIIFVAILAAILIIWYSFWHGIQISIATNSKKIKTIKTSVVKLEQELKTIKDKLQAQQITGLGKRRAKILSADQTKIVLHDILMTNKHLTLMQLENIPPEEVMLPKNGTKAFKHGIMIKFSGNYFATMNYLQEIEKLPWRIYWDQLEYKVTKYPAAQITLYLHTMSNKNEWLHI